MGNSKKKKEGITEIARTILFRIVKLDDLLTDHPEVFNFNALDFYEKITLARNSPDKFNFLLAGKLSSEEKYVIAADRSLKKLQALHPLTDDELNELSNDRYYHLVREINFDKYIRKDKFLKLGKRLQASLFEVNPDWYIKEISATDLPPLSSKTLAYISSKKPKYIDEYIKDFSQFSTTDHFWLNMIKYDEKYKDIFLENTKSVINKSAVRYVFYRHPSLIKLINVKNISNMKLTTKEIILLMNQIIKDNENVFKDWEPDADLKEALRLDVTAELLTGKSKISKRLTSSLKSVTSKEEQTEDVSDNLII